MFKMFCFASLVYLGMAATVSVSVIVVTEVLELQQCCTVFP
jgi:hypothetical protein